MEVITEKALVVLANDTRTGVNREKRFHVEVDCIVESFGRRFPHKVKTRDISATGIFILCSSTLDLTKKSFADLTLLVGQAEIKMIVKPVRFTGDGVGLSVVQLSASEQQKFNGYLKVLDTDQGRKLPAA